MTLFSNCIYKLTNNLQRLNFSLKIFLSINFHGIHWDLTLSKLQLTNIFFLHKVFFFLVAESSLDPLLPSNCSSELQRVPLILCCLQTVLQSCRGFPSSLATLQIIGMAGFVGEAVLSGFIRKLVDMVASPELWNYARKEKVDSELKKWKKILIKIHPVLHDAEEKQMTNPLVKLWLDNFVIESLQSSAQPQQGTSMVRGIFSSLILSASPSNFSMGSKIEEITARLQYISAQKNGLDLREIAAGWSDRKRKRAQILPTTCLVVESCVYGREIGKAIIVDMLLKDDPSSDDEISVIPIIGMGGIGKTTLARLAFNDEKVEGHFDLRAWVCVSDELDVLRITKAILQSVYRSGANGDVNDLNLLQVDLKKSLFVWEEVSSCAGRCLE